jgi:hypothetical protein
MVRPKGSSSLTAPQTATTSEVSSATTLQVHPHRHSRARTLKIRAEFNIATPRVLLYSIGEAGVDEDFEDLPDPDDDVLRIPRGPVDGSARRD